MSHKKKPALYYFGKFINTLREKNAEIKIFGNTYSSNNKDLTIKSLVQEICKFESPNKIDTITRNGELSTENSRKGKISTKQKNVINQLDFYFRDLIPSHKSSNRGIHVKEYPYQLSEKEFEALGDRCRSSEVRNQFYIERIESIDGIYPQIPIQIINSVTDSLSNDNIEDIYKELYFCKYSDQPFPDLTNKLYKGENYVDIEKGVLDIKFTKMFLPENLDKFVRKYKIANSDKARDDKNWAPEVVAPQYTFKHTGDPPKQKSKKFTYKKVEEDFSEPDNWFDEFRFRRLQSIRSELLNINVNDWPQWTIEHVILAQWEFICLMEQVEEIVINELKNSIRFTLNTSTDGKTIDMQTDDIYLEELGEILTHYRFPGGIEKHLNIERNNLFDGSFYKYPDGLIARNQQPAHIITLKIEIILATYLCNVLCSYIGLSEKSKDDVIDRIDERYHDLVFGFQFEGINM